MIWELIQSLAVTLLPFAILTLIAICCFSLVRITRGEGDVLDISLAACSMILLTMLFILIVVIARDPIEAIKELAKNPVRIIALYSNIFTIFIFWVFMRVGELTKKETKIGIS